MDIFPKYFPDFCLEADMLFDKNYSIKISTKRSLSDLVNYAALFFVLNILHNKNDYFEGNESQLTKYIHSMGRLNAPYFMRYIFRVNLVRSEKKFKEHKELLEAVEGKKIEMVFGNTNEQRLNAVKDKINKDQVILEIGCGEGNTTLALAKKAIQNDLPYYAIDIDEAVREIVANRAGRKKLTNVVLLESFEAFTELDDRPVPGMLDVLLVEVIEHMEKEAATEFVKKVLDFCKTDARTLIVTTPNIDFNVNYALEGYRHDDHKFEFTQAEFDVWVEDLTEEGIQAYPFGIGDTVDGVVTTLGVQFMFKKEEVALC